jgi:hypothetical protein
MDDGGGNFADETNDMAAENLIGASELRKRRSTRIVQAVPLAVTGVDALGRPFTERTSTLIINCHGCRYQSKHYVLKNMWVTLEIPHPEGGQSARNVRGRVAWIQRPRTVRQLFQVALELEQPGNAWGMAFPPEDWFSFPEAAPQGTAAGATGGNLPAMPGDAEATGNAGQGEHAAGFLMGDAARQDAGAAAAGGVDNVRIFPSPVSTTDASLQLARQMSRLLNDAKQQMQAAARDAATHAVSAERHTAFEQWEQKFAAARVEVVNEAERAIARIQKEAEEQTQRAIAAAEEAAEKARTELPGAVTPQLHDVAQGLTGKLAEEGAAQRAQFEKDAASAAETLRGLCEQADAAVGKLTAHRETVEAQLELRMDAANKILDETRRALEERARGLEESQRTAEALVRRLEGELSAHGDAILSAARESERRLAEVSGLAAQSGEAAKAASHGAVQELHDAANAARAQLAVSETEAGVRHAALQTASEASWRTQLAAEMEAAKGRWQEFVGEAIQQSVADAVATAMSGAKEEATRAVDEHARGLRERLYDEARHHVSGLIDEQLGARIEGQLRDRVDPEVEARVAAQIERQIPEKIGGPLNEHVEKYLAEHLEGRVNERIADRLQAQLERHAADLQAAAERVVGETEQRVAGLRDVVGQAAGEHEKRATELQEAEKRMAGLRELAEGAADDAERRVTGLRASTEEFVNGSLKEQTEKLEPLIWRAGESIGKLEHFSARLDTAQDDSLHGFRAQLDDVLSLHRNELHRRSEALLEEMTGRMRGAFAEAQGLALGEFAEKLAATVRPHVAQAEIAVQSAEEAVHRLAGGRSLLDAAMTLQQDRIRGFADEAFAESLARFRENLGSVDQILQEASLVITDKSLGELRDKAEDLKHGAIEDLLKSSEWYEKKAQTHIQTATERAVENAGNLLREKAGEISGAFAGEVDHASRNFVGHTQTQMEEVLRDAFERSRVLFAEAAETTEAAFTDEIQRAARRELAGFGEEVLRSASEMRTQIETARVELALRTTAEQEDFLRRFQAGMNAAMEGTVAEARKSVEASFAPLLDSVRGLREAHQNEVRGVFERAAEEAAEVHRVKLQGISNQWILATVASLDQQARGVVANIAAAAEEQLRVACEQVFAGVGDSLRERMREIAAGMDLKAKGKSA